MKNFSTWLLVMFMVMFWIFRIIVTLAGQLNWNFGGFMPLNEKLEIILLFVVLICIVLIVKRKIIGGLIYLLSYGMYFGIDLYNNIQNMLIPQSGFTIQLNIYTNTIISLIGMIIPIAILIDLLADKSRKNNPKDSKTDWFFQNEKFDRKMDERADKNNYRTY